MLLDATLYKTDIARKMAATINFILRSLWLALAGTRVGNPRVGLAFALMMRTTSRLDRLAQRWRSGLLVPPRRRAPRPRAAASDKPLVVYPSGNGWLARIAPTISAGRPLLESFLDDAETRALLAAAPQSGRLFRPLCRMLGIDIPAHLQLPERPKRVRAKPESQPAPAPARQSYPFPGVPRRWQTRIPGINAPRLKNKT